MESSQNIKDGKVSKEVADLKSSKEQKDTVTDFFERNGKDKRGTDTLVENASEELKEEGAVKEELYKKSLEVVGIPDTLKPVFTGVFLTARRNKLQQDGIYLPTAAFGGGVDTDLNVDFSETQVVLATGPFASQVAVGMEVVINIDNFKERLDQTMAQKVNKEFIYRMPVEVIDGVEYIYITERDIKYIKNTNGIAIPEIKK